MTSNPEELEARILSAYAHLADGISPWAAVKLADLRERVGADRDDMDRALKQMARNYGAHIHSEADQKTLTDRDRAAAIVLGGTARHTLFLEACYGQPHPTISPSAHSAPVVPEYQPRHARPEPPANDIAQPSRSLGNALHPTSRTGRHRRR